MGRPAGLGAHRAADPGRRSWLSPPGNHLRQHCLHFRAYRLQSKLILVSTAGLLLLRIFPVLRVPAATVGGALRPAVLHAAAFQAVTPRTAGFNSATPSGASPASWSPSSLRCWWAAPPAPPPAALEYGRRLQAWLQRLVIFRRGSPSCFGRRFQDEAAQRQRHLSDATAFFLLGGTLIC